MSFQICVRAKVNLSYLNDWLLSVYESFTVRVLINTVIMEGDTMCPSKYALVLGQIQAIYIIQC